LDRFNLFSNKSKTRFFLLFFGETVFQKPFERLHQSRESITAGLYIEAEPRGNPKEKKKVKLPRSKIKK